MPRYKTIELSAADIGRDQAEMLATLVENLKKKGIKDELIEKIAVNISGAASSWLDGCKGMESPAELVSYPFMRGGAIR